MTEIDNFVARFVDDIRDESAAIFAGAGLSIPAGLVDWRGLMRSIAQDVGLDVDKETDLVSVAQFHVNERRGRHRINEALVAEFAERASLSRNHEVLAALPIRTYWTTNYDTLIEHALRLAKRRVDVKHSDRNLAYTMRQRDAVVYKMHGDVSQPDDAVVTRDDYELYRAKRPLMNSALQGDLVSKTFLFLGFSFSDPNLNYVFGRIRGLLGEHRREHYSLMRRVHRNDFGTDAEYAYAQHRQDLQTSDLRRYGIQSLLLDSYEGIAAILEQIRNGFRRRRVFVSGSAATYDPLPEAEGQDLVRRIGKGLVESGFDVVSGFGLGLGPYLLNGALEGLANTGSSSVNDRLILRPFPQGIVDPSERAERWSAYRTTMISEAGIALFLFGNKRNGNGSIVHADGMLAEFEMAREQGLLVVPLGFTGYAASQILAVVLADFDEYYPGRPELRKKLETLNVAASDGIVDELVRFLNVIREGA